VDDGKDKMARLDTKECYAHSVRGGLSKSPSGGLRNVSERFAKELSKSGKSTATGISENRQIGRLVVLLITELTGTEGCFSSLQWHELQGRSDSWLIAVTSVVSIPVFEAVRGTK